MKPIQPSIPTTLQRSGYNVNYRHLKGNQGEINSLWEIHWSLVTAPHRVKTPNRSNEKISKKKAGVVWVHSGWSLRLLLSHLGGS